MKKKVSIGIILLLLIAAAGILYWYFNIRALPIEEVAIKPSVVWVDKTDPTRMKLMVKKYNLKRGRYEAPSDYLIKGVVYQVVQIGQAPPWYDSWFTHKSDPIHRARVDEDKNGVLTENEKEVGDFKLMQEMGVNTIRLYDPIGLNESPDPFVITPEEIQNAKDILRELYRDYGIMVIMGHSLGYQLDYSDPDIRWKLHDEVIAMVEAYKDEPWVLMWNLGNENNIQIGSTRREFSTDYYKETVQKIAAKIKDIDPNHPISISNLGLAGVFDFNKYCKDVDIYGANMYQSHNFSGLWNTAARINRPAYLTEFGCDVLDSRETPRVPNEKLQAEFVAEQWEDIEANHYAGAGSSLGGVYFEWLDEWWKAPYDNSAIHTYEGGWDAPSFDSGTRESGNEEWWGLCAQNEDGIYSPNYRYLREVYYKLKELWTAKK
jgi:beta-glucuronidase